MVASFTFQFSHIAVVGSRRPASASVVAAASFCRHLAAWGGSVSVGCASGVDAVVRSSVPAAVVFRAALPSPSGASSVAVAAALIARSVAVVRSLPVLGGGAVFAFPLGVCPAGLLPSRSSARCFAGFGSGSWAAVAFAVGRGVPVFVFCPSGGLSLPASWGGSWVSVSVGGVVFFQFVPFQSSLF